MSYDPVTFKNLYPFPDTRKIKEGIEQKILNGELKVPSDYILDSKEWIDGMAEDQCRYERNLWDKSEGEAISAWRKHQETEHGFKHLPDDLKKKIHGQVWQDAHAFGYGDMENKYYDWVPVILETYEIGYSSGAHDICAALLVR